MAQVRPQPLRWFGYEGGLVELGHSAALDGAFCFDNETPRHRAYAAPFELASRPATFGDFLAFIDDDGYRRPELWLSMGWDWVRSGARTAPLYWRRDGGRWLIHTLQGAVEIDPHTPVCHLSFFEADAFARWSGARLPTELEWELAARRLAAPVAGNFADRGAFHPLPQKEPVGDEPVQMFGDVWEWTQSAYLPVSRLPAAPRRGRRVQRQVHVQPVRPARRLVRDAGRSRPRELPQFLPARRAVAVQRRSPRPRRLGCGRRHRRLRS